MFAKHFLASLLSGSLILAAAPAGFADQTSQPTNQIITANAKQTPEQLQQLVAPIALYPDELVAEVLAAATYPAQVVEADRWLEDKKSLQAKQLADAVNKQPGDSSVKGLTEFPSVLANMDKNLSWTSSLGDAYMNQQKDVMDAVQVMRQRADAAGNLKSNSQQKVEKKGKTVIIEPAHPEVVYVPTYDPWIVYGEPLGVWPGWYTYPGLYIVTAGISFGFGFGVGFFGGYGWGWHHWDSIGGIAPSSSITIPTSLAVTGSSTGPMCIGDERLFAAAASQEVHDSQARMGLRTPMLLQVTCKLVHLREPLAERVMLVWRGAALLVASTAVVVGGRAQAV
jgi:hypothetical protein